MKGKWFRISNLIQEKNIYIYYPNLQIGLVNLNS